MNVEADVVSQVVRKERLEGSAGHVEAEIEQVCREVFLGEVVEVVEGSGGVGTAEGDACALNGDDGVIEI